MTSGGSCILYNTYIMTTINKIDENTIEVIETVETRTVYKKNELERNKADMQCERELLTVKEAEIDNLLKEFK